MIPPHRANDVEAPPRSPPQQYVSFDHHRHQPTSSASDTLLLLKSNDSTLTVLERSYAHLSKPFKANHHHHGSTTTKKKATTPAVKKYKNLKQILVLEKERLEKRRAIAAAEPKNQQSAIEDSIQAGEVHVAVEESYSSIEAAPSVVPKKKYCDITGLEANYTHPSSTLHYHNAEIYQLIKHFNPQVVQEYLTLRGDGVVLR